MRPPVGQPPAGRWVRNFSRALVLSLTRGRLAGAPVGGPAATYYRKLAWASASFALLADLAMAALGADLKRKEKLTGRFADVFAWMYLAAAVLRRFEAEGDRQEDVAFLDWSMRHAFDEMQQAFDGLYKNLSVPGLGWLFRGPVAAWSRLNRLSAPPSDALGSRVAQALQVPGEQRDRLTAGIFLPTDRERAVGRLEHAFALAYEAEGVVRKLKQAIRARRLPKAPPLELADEAVSKGILSSEERQLLERAEAARDDAIQVDSFSLEEYMESAVVPAAGVKVEEPEPELAGV